MSPSITTVYFHDTMLIAQLGATPTETLVAMKPVVEGMGLAWQPQLEKIREHPVLETCMVINRVQMPGGDQRREMVFLPLNRLNFWLATIHPNRVPDPDTRARVIEYQTECADALFAHFFGQSHSMTGNRPEVMVRMAMRGVCDRFGIKMGTLECWIEGRYRISPIVMVEHGRGIELVEWLDTLTGEHGALLAAIAEAAVRQNISICDVEEDVERHCGKEIDKMDTLTRHQAMNWLTKQGYAKTDHGDAMVKSMSVTMEVCVPMDKAQRILAIVNE